MQLHKRYSLISCESMSVQCTTQRSELCKDNDYDYDKSLKSKTKDIQLLQQQIAALDGVTDAESRAMKARLEADLAEQQEDLDDTVREHVYELQVQGLEDLQEDLEERYEDYVEALSSNLDTITDAVKDATTTVNKSLSTVTSNIQKLLASYGVSGLNTTTVGLTGYASGTRRVGKDKTALTNERGGEIVIGDRGVFFPLSASSSVMSAQTTNKLWGLADHYDDIMSVAHDSSQYLDIQGYEGNIAPVINAPITITGNQIDEQGVIRAINKQLPVISKTVQNDIRKDLRKSR